jgi:predicted SAM-dependent methyltransferase
LSAKSRAKTLAKRLASPFTKRVYGRIDFRVAEIRRDFDAVPALIDSRTSELEAQIEAFNRYLPTVINTIASQNAASRATQRQLQLCQTQLQSCNTQLESCQTRLEALQVGVEGHAATIVETRARIEYVRKEIMLEQRYGRAADPTSAPSGEDGNLVAPRVMNEQKVRAMEGNLRVNVGAGHITRDDYLNVDSRELPGIDIVADVRQLPFQPEQLKELYSAHLLEHFPVEELRRVILPRWVSLLKDGGKLVSVVPDVETMVSERAARRMPFDDFVEVMYGGQEYAGDFHFSGFSKETLTRLLEDVGLEDVKVVEEGRRNGACYEMEIEAVRRISSTV